MSTKTLSALLMVPLFMALALPGLAQEATPTPTPVFTPGAGLACMQTAVETRDNAIIAAFDAFSASAKSALQARRDALKAAWAITDRKARRAAIKKAWNDFGTATKTARKTLNSARSAAWKQYSKDARSCKKQGALTSDDYGTQGREESL